MSTGSELVLWNDTSLPAISATLVEVDACVFFLSIQTDVRDTISIEIAHDSSSR